MSSRRERTCTVSHRLYLFPERHHHPDRPPRNRFTAAAYAQDTWSLFHDKVQIIPGIRYTWFDQTGRGYWEPRASLSAQLTNHIRLKGAWGYYNQFAKRVIREDLLQGSRDFWILADGDRLPVSSAIHYIAGFALENDGFLFDVEGYYKQLSGLSEYSLRFIPSFGEIKYNEQFYNGRGEVRGLDVLLQRNTANTPAGSATAGAMPNTSMMYMEPIISALRMWPSTK